MNNCIRNSFLVTLSSLSKAKQVSLKQISFCSSQGSKLLLTKPPGFLRSWREPYPAFRFSSTQSDKAAIDAAEKVNSEPKKISDTSSEAAQSPNCVVGTADGSSEGDALDVKFITNGDPLLERKLKVLFLEVEVLRQEGRRVPASIRNDQWKELVNCATRTGRKKYLAFLWGIEMTKQNQKRKKEELRAVREEAKDPNWNEDDGTLRYGLNHNTIYMRIYDTTINQLYNNKLVQAMQFGQKIVLDCSYDRYMNTREALNAAKQIMITFAENRMHKDPYDLYLCNCDRNGHTMSQLHRFISTMYDDSFPLNVTENSYLDLFPKESIVYLTPHCREELTTYSHDDIYVIGAMVDKVNQDPLSLAKAKKEGLRMAKLPLERYLNWGSGSGKSLTLNQMILIMLEMKSSGDWMKALEHVPRRKINFDEEPGYQYKARNRQQFRYKKSSY